ncbi:hypothetical protein [Pseudonocardia sp.]|uniref:hypothetical protein n=1 Tax=Pseudonocardia sp. TaxID=60912 RepID=UPI002605AB84|nr:hypothetical protein [Pseudonocardia sp.]
MPDPTQYPPAVLRLHPDAVPGVRVAIDATLDELSPLLRRMEDEAVMPEPWLGDSASHSVWTAYNEGVMRAPDGAFRAVLAYESQLLTIRDRLVEIERHYARNEADTGALFGNRL